MPRRSAGSPSSVETPITCKWSGYRSCNWIRCGISSRHGPHQVAQKFTSATFPCQSPVDSVRPSSVCIESALTGSGSRSSSMVMSPENSNTGSGAGTGSLPGWLHPASIAAATTAPHTGAWAERCRIGLPAFEWFSIVPPLPARRTGRASTRYVIGWVSRRPSGPSGSPP